MKQFSYKQLGFLIAGLVLLNILSAFFFFRVDLTADSRYTLSQQTLEIVDKIDKPLYLDVFLEGKFPGEFKRLQTETLQLLEEFEARNSNIKFEFVNPLENETKQDSVIQAFVERGLMPVRVSVQEKGVESQETVFPWAVASLGDKSTKVPLLKNGLNSDTQQKVISSVQHLEYAFANAIKIVSTEKTKKVAVMKGNGEIDDIKIADFITSVRDQYRIGTFTLDSVGTNPQKAAAYLKKYDLIVVAKPTEAFSDAEKQVLDQFIIHGGKSVWLMDQVAIETDSLFNERGSAIAFPRNQTLNLDDLFFKYGIRIAPVLVKDIGQATPIALATGQQGSNTTYSQFPWFYAPFSYPPVTTDNPIVSNIDGVKFEYANGIELLNNNIKKTVLLESSKLSIAVGTPVEVRLSMVEERPDQATFANAVPIPLAVLLEGKFTSVFNNRVLAFPDKTFLGVAKKPTAMIVIADGDVIKNQFDSNGVPLELGFDKWTNKFYGNKEFILNSINYLLDDSKLIYLRNKEIILPILDRNLVAENYVNTQIYAIVLPLIALGLAGVLIFYFRKRKYAR